MISNLAFITCIESGYLESQSLLLYESIRRYGGCFSQFPVYAFSPRVGYEISPETKKHLEKLSVEHIDLVLNDEFPHDPYANKILANAYIENQKKHDFLVFLDSDTLFFREPTALELPNSYDVAVRPVSRKSICTSGEPDDPHDNYWHLLCQYCGVDYQSIPLLETFVEGVMIKACYNAGLVVVRANKGIFSKWRDDFITVYREGLEPKQESVLPKDQTTLSMAIWGITDRVQVLEPIYNYPILSINKKQPLLQFNSSHTLIHIHYHSAFKAENLSTNPLFQSNFELEAELKTWLLARLPLDSGNL
ncbi:MAG: hypothetical protein O4808_15665 [Trichodesmium sp. St17_bin3_1_1]|nr:hypothetical protein [Trichodesmium sp. St17_bin3_1_1]